MVKMIRAHKKTVMAFLIAMTMVASFAQGRRHKHSNRVVYISMGSKVYALLSPTGMSKSLQQMQAEALAGRARFKNLYEKNIEEAKDLMKFTTPVRDQGHRGTCVAFATMALMETEAKFKNGANLDLSEQYAYWASKAIEKVDPNADGSAPLGMLNAMDKHGVPVENAWPYEKNPWYARADHKDCTEAYKANPDDIPTDCLTNGAPPAAAKTAKHLTVSKEMTIETSPESIVGYIENNIPVEIAVDIYKNAWGFNDPTSANFRAGMVSMPAAGDTPVGGHAVLVVGYDKQNKVYLFKNSWGRDQWGAQSKFPGFGIIPMDYVRKYGEATVARLNFEAL